MSLLDDLWKDAVGGAKWLAGPLLGEFMPHQSTSQMVTGMLASFIPGSIIVMSARDMTAVILRMVSPTDPHHEPGEELTDWMILIACALGIVPVLIAAAAGAAAAGVGSVVGAAAGGEFGAALRAVALLLVEGSRALEELMLFLRRFLKGDVLKFLQELKFAKYAEAVTGKVVSFLEHMRGVTNRVIETAKSVRWIGQVDAILARLENLEKAFYKLQGKAASKIGLAMEQFDARLQHALADHTAQADHVVHPNTPAPRPTPHKVEPVRVSAHVDPPIKPPPDLKPAKPMPERTPPENNLHPQGVEPEPSAPKLAPAARDLEQLSTTNAKGVEVKPVRVLDGTNGKVAIIGRSMDDAVNPMAGEVSSKGYEVETFTGDQIPDSAKLDWENLKAKYAPNYIPDDAVKNSEMFQANQAWAEKLKAQGYTVVDVGNPMSQGSSPFFDMEKSTIFGDTH